MAAPSPWEFHPPAFRAGLSIKVSLCLVCVAAGSGAKSLLRTTTCDVREISDALSFSSPAYFGKVFRQQTSMTPKAYQHAQG